jgi:hypothetical protein
MIEDESRSPATKATVDLWISTYKLNHDVCADPTESLAGGGSIGLPYNVIVDPRTMKVVKIIEGDGPSVESTINALVKTNGG